jgi:hypothetical protein
MGVVSEIRSGVGADRVLARAWAAVLRRACPRGGAVALGESVPVVAPPAAATLDAVACGCTDTSWFTRGAPRRPARRARTWSLLWAAPS